jgi:hypothetical protein
MFQPKYNCFLITLLCFFGGCEKNKIGLKNKSVVSTQKAEEKSFRKFNLEYLMVGKNQIEVEDLMGLPEGKTLGQDGVYLWDYRRPVYDDETGNIFEWSLITFHFSQGKCSRVDVSLSDLPAQLSDQQLFP